MTEEKEQYGTESSEIAKRRIATIADHAESFVIVTVDDYQRAAEGLKLIKGEMIRVDKTDIEPLRDIKRRADGEMKRLTELYVAPLKRAETILKDKQITWNDDQERIRMKEQARVQAEADARAEKERARLMKEAEKLKTPELKEQRIMEAETVQAMPITLARSAPAIKGQSFARKWKGEIVDELTAIRALAAKDEAAVYLKINQAELDGYINRTNGLNAIPGVRNYLKTVMSSASK